MRIGSIFIFSLLVVYNFIFHPFVFFEQTQLENKKSQPLFEIDAKSLYLVEERGGGIYYDQVDAIVPLFPELIQKEWLHDKNLIAKRIGPIFPAPSKESDLWRNSASTVEELVEDIEMASPDFIKMCKWIKSQTKAKLSFGIQNKHMKKSKKSIERKIQEYVKLDFSREDSITKIRDSLRGTFTLEFPEQIPLVVEKMKEYAKEINTKVVFINIWEENRPSGYVGIHAKMLFPILDRDGKETNRNVIIEIQIHLKCIMDGTPTCVKEREHLLYEQMLQKSVDSKIQTAASNLLYLTALKQCPAPLGLVNK